MQPTTPPRYNIQMLPGPNATPACLASQTNGAVSILIAGGMTSLQAVSAQLLAAMIVSPFVIDEQPTRNVIERGDVDELQPLVENVVRTARLLLETAQRLDPQLRRPASERESGEVAQ